MLADRGRADVEVRSGGIAPYARDTSLVSLDARFVLRDYGVEIPADTTSCDLKRHAEHFVWADLIVAMTRQHRQMIIDLVPDASEKTRSLLSFTGTDGDIDDPFGGNTYAYRLCLQGMKPALRTMLELVKNQQH